MQLPDLFFYDDAGHLTYVNAASISNISFNQHSAALLTACITLSSVHEDNGTFSDVINVSGKQAEILQDWIRRFAANDGKLNAAATKVLDLMP